MIIKDFIQSQGRRSRFQLKLNGSLDGIISELSVALGKGKVRSSSVVAADLVSIGDSWLNYAIKQAIIQPIEGVEDQDWFKSLSNKWKVSMQICAHDPWMSLTRLKINERVSCITHKS